MRTERKKVWLKQAKQHHRNIQEQSHCETSRLREENPKRNRGQTKRESRGNNRVNPTERVDHDMTEPTDPGRTLQPPDEYRDERLGSSAVTFVDEQLPKGEVLRQGVKVFTFLLCRTVFERSWRRRLCLTLDFLVYGREIMSEEEGRRRVNDSDEKEEVDANKDEDEEDEEGEEDEEDEEDGEEGVEFAPIDTSMMKVISITHRTEEEGREDVVEATEDLKKWVSYVLSKRKEGTDFNDKVRRDRNFRNPAILEKMVAYCELHEFGTNMPEER